MDLRSAHCCAGWGGFGRPGALTAAWTLAAVVALCPDGALQAAVAAAWPTYRGDASRSGFVPESLPEGLGLHWVYHARHGPRPAWSGRDTRMPFDAAFHVVATPKRVFFGSSADDKVYALEAGTGRTVWTFFTSGPVRFAPTLWQDRLFVVSDDGWLYCLDQDGGRVLWKRRGGPDASRVLGNGRIISRWPARGAPAVADGLVYFAAGIWPTEGIFVYALDAESGELVWQNDSAGRIHMGQPHGGAEAESGVSAQGYLVVAGDVLLVPTGRAVPAAFRRRDGRFKYFHLQANGRWGGSEVTAAGDLFLNGGLAFDVTTGSVWKSLTGLAPNLVAVLPDGVVWWKSGSVHFGRIRSEQSPDRRGRIVTARRLESLWSCPVPYGGAALIVAGDTAVSAGAGKEGYGLCTIDLAARRSDWSATVDSLPRGLAAAGGRLFASTDRGTIWCFAEGGPAEPQEIYAGSDRSERRGEELYAQTAEEILRRGGVTEGYCVDLACGDGRLAYALASRSKLRIDAIDDDPDAVAAARSRLDAAGVYGVRVTVHLGDPTCTGFPDYFANLVVSDRSAASERPAGLEDEIHRILRPWGGVACIGQPGAMRQRVRGPLDGAGTWTHQYADPGNSNCSGDRLARGPLGMLWFTDLAFPVPNRHGRGRAPLLLDGRLFIQGIEGVLCVDAYNGRKLWYHPLPGIQAVYDGEHLMGTSGTGSNWCVSREGLFVHTGGECLRLDTATGRLLARYPAPPQPDGRPGTWGVIAVSDGTLFGTLANTEHLVTYRFRPGEMRTQYTESVALVALDISAGQLRWTYEAEHSIRHNALAIGRGRVHLIDRPLALGDRKREKRRGVPDPGDLHPPGKLVTLDARHGEELWQSSEDIFGTVLALSSRYETLVMCYQDWRFKLASERGGRMAGFDAGTGRRLWDIRTDAVTRPVINGRTIYMQPGAWDLRTGEQLDFRFQRSYGCGLPAGSANLLVFRSATFGYVDLTGPAQTQNYGGIRPGCWINAIPAGGLVLMPDATDRCTCSYLLKASIALAPRQRRSGKE